MSCGSGKATADVLVLANPVRDVLDMVRNELDVDLVRTARREGGIEAVVSLLVDVTAGASSLDHDHPVDLVLASPELVEHLVRDIARNVVEVSTGRV